MLALEEEKIMKGFYLSVAIITVLVALGIVSSNIHEREIIKKEDEIKKLNEIVREQQDKIDTYKINLKELNKQLIIKENEIIEIEKQLTVLNTKVKNGRSP
ncbi:hypothetical protein KDN24_06945 [Bacillus sp. Bva_UNVM-123]|uniref:hypothetical protein n=1 Tax=Bacillus sp. Bva_UNVM-123 TaxID=2829798 RepID=UPI00391F837A